MSQAAARCCDLVCHAPGTLGALIGGAVGACLGAFVGAAVGLGATMLSGRPAVGGAAAAATLLLAVETSMSMGQSMAKSIRALFGLPDPTTGLLWTGSVRVLINDRPAIRAELDKAACHGRWLLDHLPRMNRRVATGSATVLIEGKAAGRVGDLLECSAKIKTGSANVHFGGAPVPVLRVHPTNTQRVQRWLIEGASLFAGVVVMAAIHGAQGLVEERGCGVESDLVVRLLCVVQWDQVETYSYAETKDAIATDQVAKYGDDPARLQADINAMIEGAEANGYIADSIANGFYGSPRHRQFGEWVSDLTEGAITPEQAMMMQPFGGDMGPGTGYYAAGLLGRHSLIHDVEGFLGMLGLGPGYGGAFPDNKFSGQVEGILREGDFPSDLDLAR